MLYDYTGKCIECQNDGLLYDDLKGEIFCRKCGLIISDKYSIISVPDILEQLHLEELHERKELMKNLE